MSLPKVSVGYSNGNLLQQIDAIDGIAGVVVTVDSNELIGVVNIVYNLLDAETKGYTLVGEPFAHSVLKEFYAEVAGNQKLYILGTADTMTMAGALDKEDVIGAIKLIRESEGTVRLLGVCRKPDDGYDPGTAFLDADVEAAVLASKTFCEAQLAELRPLRVLIDGRVVNEDSNDIYEPKTSSNGFAGVVLGGKSNTGTASVGAALGRLVKYGSEIKIGKVANGPLSFGTAYIGTKDIKTLFNLAELHGKGFISFMKHPGKAGIYFGIDRMASTDDYRLLAHGRVVDKAAIIAAATYTEEIEDEVNVDPVTGFIDETEIKHMESKIEQQVNAGMGNQISGIEFYINPAQDIINTDTLNTQLRVIPKGYKSFINVDLGLKSPATT